MDHHSALCFFETSKENRESGSNKNTDEYRYFVSRVTFS